jgi:hypothetical protein
LPYVAVHNCYILLLLLLLTMLQITAMLSSAGEVVQLDTPVKITDRVEEWLVRYFNMLNFERQQQQFASWNRVCTAHCECVCKLYSLKLDEVSLHFIIITAAYTAACFGA